MSRVLARRSTQALTQQLKGNRHKGKPYTKLSCQRVSIVLRYDRYIEKTNGGPWNTNMINAENKSPSTGSNAQSSCDQKRGLVWLQSITPECVASCEEHSIETLNTSAARGELLAMHVFMLHDRLARHCAQILCWRKKSSQIRGPIRSNQYPFLQ